MKSEHRRFPLADGCCVLENAGWELLQRILILLLVHLLVQLFPLALTYLALIPSRYQL
jgi:hypothetical protein